MTCETTSIAIANSSSRAFVALRSASTSSRSSASSAMAAAPRARRSRAALGASANRRKLKNFLSLIEAFELMRPLLHNNFEVSAHGR